MADFLLRSETNNAGKAAMVMATAATKKIEISNWANQFTAEQLAPLEEWITAYHKKNSEILTISLTNAWSAFPYVPKQQMQFGHLYTYYDNTTYSPIARIVNSIPIFNLQVIGNNPDSSPKITTDAEYGMIQISGNSFTSLHIETYQPLFAWIEKYLSVPGRTIRAEFWLEYFNSSSSKSLLETLDLLKFYEKNHEGTVNVYWYYQQHDTDMLDDGQEMREDSGLEIHFIPLEQEKWKLMYAKM